MTNSDRIYARLFGRFRVWDSSGNDLTPKSAKSQAILALLLTSENYDRGRMWLQDKLWSDRAPTQGSASLRQALTEIRKALGTFSGILQTDRKTVSLDPSRISLSLENSSTQAEFLEGIDVKDDEFNSWLASQRAQSDADLQPLFLPAPTSARTMPVVLMMNESPDLGPCQITETLFIDAVIKTLREEVDIDVLRRPPLQTPRGMLIVSVQAFFAPNKSMGVRASLEEADTGRPLWSEMQVSPSQGAPIVGDVPMLGLGNRLASHIVSALCKSPSDTLSDPDANLLTTLAVQKMFSMRRKDLIAAEGLLLAAFEADPRGGIQGWLAQLYSIQYIERVWPLEDLRDKSEAACARALEMDPGNSNVLASVADASLVVRRNLARCAQLARMAVTANPANPLAWWTLASAHLYYGEPKAAHEAATKAQLLASGTRFQFWTDIQRGLAAIVNGKTIEGIQLLESSSALSPEFHPPLRYLTALYSAAGLTQSAQETADKLVRLEPDFSFERLANDPDYPVSLMRQHGMLDTVELR